MQVILNQLNMHDALANSLIKGARRTTQRWAWHARCLVGS